MGRKTTREAGLKVVVEARPRMRPDEFTEHTPAYKLKYRGPLAEIVRTRPIRASGRVQEYNTTGRNRVSNTPTARTRQNPCTWQRCACWRRAIVGEGPSKLS